MAPSCVVVLAWLAAAVAAPQATQRPEGSLIAGTWILNLSKSIYEGTGAPRSVTVTIEDRGDGLVVTRSEAVLEDGNRNVTESASKCDGKDYPLVLRQGRSVPLATSCVATTARTFEIDLKQENGELLQKTVRRVAEDGKTMTETVIARLPDGQQVRVVAILEKQ